MRADRLVLAAALLGVVAAQAAIQGMPLIIRTTLALDHALFIAASLDRKLLRALQQLLLPAGAWFSIAVDTGTIHLASYFP